MMKRRIEWDKQQNLTQPFTPIISPQKALFKELIELVTKKGLVCNVSLNEKPTNNSGQRFTYIGPLITRFATDEEEKQNVQVTEESTFDDLYELGKIIEETDGSSGAKSTVCFAKHRPSEGEVVVKYVTGVKSADLFKNLLHEIDFLRGGNQHNFIVKIMETYEEPDTQYLVLEKMRGGDLLDRLEKSGAMNECSAKFILIQILSAIRFMHQLDYVHCDIKPENILLSDASDFPLAKLSDFGHVRYLPENTLCDHYIGTENYMAPEVHKQLGFDRKQDLWSFGVTLFVVLSCNFPFHRNNFVTGYDNAEDPQFLFNHNSWKRVSQHAKDLIQKLLKINKEHRLTAEGCFGHGWFDNRQLKKNLHEKLCNRLSQNDLCIKCRK